MGAAVTRPAMFTAQRKAALAIAAEWSIPGMDPDDVRQEALVALWVAAGKHDPERGPWPPFARLSIKARMRDLLQHANRQCRAGTTLPLDPERDADPVQVGRSSGSASGGVKRSVVRGPRRERAGRGSHPGKPPARLPHVPGLEMKPRLLDLFCGAGGAAMGYHRAGFDVVGVDIRPQPNYPFEFVQADALEFVRMLLGNALPHGWSNMSIDGSQFVNFDAIHASTPCQRYSTATKRNGTELEHPDLVAATRELLKQTGLPYVIENVLGAPVRRDYILCGTAFQLETDGYRLKRHRAFEVSWPDFGEVRCYCKKRALPGNDPLNRFDYRPFMDVTGGGPTRKQRTDGGGGRPYKGTADQARRIMGIDWMTKAELNESIPPAYTEFIGHRLLAHIRAGAEAPATHTEGARG